MSFSWDNIQVVMADANSYRGGIRQRPQHFAAGLARDMGVLYIEEPGNWLTVGISPEKPWSNWTSWRDGPREVDKNLWVWTPQPGIPVGYWSKTINDQNHKDYAGALRRIAGPIPEHKLLFVACNPLAEGWLKHIKPVRSVYDCCDEFQYFPMPSKRPDVVLSIERELMRQVDVTSFSSGTTLRNKISNRAQPGKGSEKLISPGGIPRKTVLIRNGCEASHFATSDASSSPVPPDLKPILDKGPVLLYYGTIASWFNEDLTAELCKLKPEWQLVLIGPVSRKLPKLRNLPNCTLMGRRPYQTLPDYLAHAKVAILPQLISPLTDGADHVKVYEYLAAGKGVVATPLSELGFFDRYVKRGATAKDWIPLIEEQWDLSREEIDARRTFARQHTWKIRVTWFRRVLLSQEKAVIDARKEAQRQEEEEILEMLRRRQQEALESSAAGGTDETPPLGMEAVDPGSGPEVAAEAAEVRSAGDDGDTDALENEAEEVEVKQESAELEEKSENL